MNGVIAKRFQRNGGRQILHTQMRNIELARCFGSGQYIIRHLASINQHRIDTQIQIGWFFQSILRSKRIQNELEIRNSFGSLFAQLDIKTYQLYTIDYHLPIQQRFEFETGRKTVYIQHFIPLKVLQLDILDVKTVEQSQLNMTDRYFCIQQFAQLG